MLRVACHELGGALLDRSLEPARAESARDVLVKRAGGGTRASFSEQRASWEASAGAQQEVLDALRAKRDAVAAELARQESAATERAERARLARALVGPVRLFLEDPHAPALLDALSRARDECSLVDSVKAVRMVREKAQQQRATPAVATVAGGNEGTAAQELSVAADASALRQVRDAVASSPLESIQWPRAEVMEHVGAGRAAVARDLLDVAYLAAQCRFAREPRIPLYAALEHNALLALSTLGADAGVLDMFVMAEYAAQRALAEWVDAQFCSDVVAQLEDVKSPSQMPVAVKRCVHASTLARKAWSDGTVLEAPVVAAVVGSMAECVAARVVSHVVALCASEQQGGLSVEECAEWSTVLGTCCELLGSLATGTGPQRRRLRLLQQMTALDSLRELEKNLAVLMDSFDPRTELAVFVEAVYSDSPQRAAVIKRLVDGSN